MHRRVVAPVLLATVMAAALSVTGCGTQGPDGSTTPRTSASPAPSIASPAGSMPGDRATLLATCPAEAPGWMDDGPLPPGIAGEIQQRRQLGLRSDEDYVRDLDAAHAAAVAADPAVAEGDAEWSRVDSWGLVMTAAEELSLWKRQEDAEPLLAIADGYLRSLPDDQAGEVRNDAQHGRIVVQVTRDAEHVRAELQNRVGAEFTVAVETVRYSSAELKHLAARIQATDGLRLSGVGWGNGNDRVEVTVRDHPDQARALLAALADPCSYTVSVGSVTATYGTALSG